MTTFKRTTILLTQAQIDGLKQAAANDPDGLAVAQLIRVALNDFLSRRQRQHTRGPQQTAPAPIAPVHARAGRK